MIHSSSHNYHPRKKEKTLLMTMRINTRDDVTTFGFRWFKKDYMVRRCSKNTFVLVCEAAKLAISASNCLISRKFSTVNQIFQKLGFWSDVFHRVSNCRYNHKASQTKSQVEGWFASPEASLRHRSARLSRGASWTTKICLERGEIDGFQQHVQVQILKIETCKINFHWFINSDPKCCNK